MAVIRNEYPIGPRRGQELGLSTKDKKKDGCLLLPACSSLYLRCICIHTAPVQGTHYVFCSWPLGTRLPLQEQPLADSQKVWINSVAPS